MKTITLYTAKTREALKNTLYPDRRIIHNETEFIAAMIYDCIFCEVTDNRRNEGNFIGCDCVFLDLDNTHSTEPEEWKNLDDVMEALPDVQFYFVQSRNYMKAKKKTDKKTGEVTYQEPREKWHICFPLKNRATDYVNAKQIMRDAVGLFPFFDAGAAKPVQPMFGVAVPVGGCVEGELCLDEYMYSIPDLREKIAANLRDFNSKFESVAIEIESQERDSDQNDDSGAGWIEAEEQRQQIEWFKQWAEEHDQTILSSYKIDTDRHRKAVVFCVRCPWEHEHSMDGAENESVVIIDRSGQISFLCRHSHGKRFSWKQYRAEVENQNPKASTAAEQFETRETPQKRDSLEPSDYTDVGQARVFFDLYGNKIRYSTATKFLVYDGKVWRESDVKAQGLSQKLTDKQLTEAKKRVRAAQEELNKIVEGSSGESADVLEGNKAEDAKKAAKAKLAQEQAFRNYVLGRRKSAKIQNTLAEVRPMVEIGVDELDADGFLLNTPAGVVDLRTGEIRPGKPEDYCTKITAVSPDSENAELFAEFMERVTVGDKDLERYLQEVAGMCIIGKVLRENLMIAFGAGGNGKSTLFNLLARVCGDYSGGLSAETLTANCRKNKSPEYAELRGKRLIIAAELEEGMRLDTAVVKKLCSTDPILAEKKYKDPFTFTPSHTLILFTNHLPKIGTCDRGTWDRIIAIPFKARFRGEKGEIKNYSDYLFRECGGAVLSWLIEGARRFIENGCDIVLPACVSEAIEEYRSDNDWLNTFLSECTEADSLCSVRAGDLYKRYRRFCEQSGDYCRSAADFNHALDAAGYEQHKTKTGKYFHGLKLKPYSVDGFQPCDRDAWQTA